MCVHVHSTNRTLQAVTEIGDTDTCWQACTSMLCTHASTYVHVWHAELYWRMCTCVLMRTKHATMPSICSAQKKSRANSTASCTEGAYRTAAQSVLEKATVGECMYTYEITVIGSIGACRYLPVAVRHFFYRLDVLEQPRLDQLVRDLANILQPKKKHRC